ncbi:MAG: tetratricopeptide repeat protein [Candidatus Delongbacteria bacterium]|jgi:tetratricopeptide (TPR) repeat protein|nr:tetratricopeptide repeat protein [Candidatus Delongbacteria bacterium]
MKIIKGLLILTLFIYGSLFSQSGESSELAYGFKLYNNKIYDVAITQFRSFLETYGSSISAPKVQYHLADSYLQLKENEKALSNYQKIILNYPRSEYCELAITRSAELLESTDREKSARYYLQLKNYFPKSSKIPENAYKAIEIFYSIDLLGETKENIAVLRKNFPANIFTKRSMLILARIQETENQIVLAERTFKELLRTDVDELKSNVLYDHALFSIRQKRLTTAEKDLKKILKDYTTKNKYYFPALIEYSELSLSNQKFNEMSNLLYQTKNIPDEYSYTISLLKGEVEYFTNNYTKALGEFDNAKNISNTLEINIKTSYVYAKLKEFEKAGDILLNSVQVDSIVNKTEELIKISLLASFENYSKAKKYDKSITALRTFIEKYPTDENSHELKFKIGKSYYESGKYSFAFEILKEFSQNYPYSQFIDNSIFLAGESALKIEDYKSAIRLYDMILEKYSASELYTLARSRKEYLVKYKIREEDLLDDIADLSSRKLFEENTDKLIYDWGKFYYYKMKDYYRSAEYLNKYIAVIKAKNIEPDPECLYLLGSSLVNIENTDDLKLKEAYGHFMAVTQKEDIGKKILNKTNVELYDLTKKLFPKDEAKGLIEAKYPALIENNIDDVDGTLFHKFIVDIYIRKDIPRFLSYSEKFIGTRSNSKYVDEINFLRAEALYSSGETEKAIELYIDIASKKNNDTYKLRSLSKLATSPTVEPDKKISYLNSIKTEFYYSEKAASVDEQIAEIYGGNKEYNKALSVYNNLEDKLNNAIISPRWNFNVNNYSKNIADIYFTLKNFDKAEYYYRSYLASSTNDIDKQEVLLNLNDIYRSRNDSEALESNLKQIQKLSKGERSYLAAMTLADIDLDKGNYNLAIKQYNKILQDYQPEDTIELEAKIIHARFRQNKITQADELLKKFRKVHREKYDRNIFEPKFYLEKANSYLSMKSWDKALKGYKGLINDYPNSILVPKAMYGKAVIMYNIGKKDEAFDGWTELIARFPDDDISIETNFHLGAIYNNREMFDKAITAFQSIINHPKDHELKLKAYKYIIDLYVKLGFDDAAAKMIRSYVSLYPDEEDVFQKRIEIGNIYQRNEEYDQALEYFKRLMYEAKGDDEAATQFFIAETYMMMSNFRKAISEFLKVKYLMRIDSKFEWKLTAVYKTALCYEELHEYDKALDILTEIMENHPNDSYGRQAKKVIERIENKKNVKLN